MKKLKVTIVPHRRGKGVEQIILNRPESHFHVVLTNPGGKEMRVWREWCSWGYYALSFEIKDAKGEVRAIKKGVRGWTKNYPDATRIPVGENEVIDVYLQDKDVWVDSPFVKVEGSGRKPGGKVQIRAVYSIDKDEMTAEHEVWTGTVKSKWYEVQVYY